MMRSGICSAALLAATLGALPALAEDTPIEIDTDLNGDFFIVEQAGSETRPVVLVKRVDGDYTYYVKREFDCESSSVRLLGEGESRKAVADSEPEQKMRAYTPGSIAGQLAKHVCPEPEAEPEAEPGPESGDSSGPAQE